MATATRKMTTFRLSCPECGDAEAITINLNDLTNCCCRQCDEQFTPAEAVAKMAERLARWQAVVRWVETAGEAMAAGE